MKSKIIAALALSVSIPVMGHAQQGPSFDCSNADSSAEKLVCEDAGLAALDVRLAERFEEAVKVAQGLDAGADETEATLRAYQRGWISGRDECWKEPNLRDCVETSYQRRDAELVAEFLLEEPTEVFELFCGDGARSMMVYTFGTDLPGVRVEEGDTLHVGALLSADEPGVFYLRSAGGLSLVDGDLHVADVYDTQTACRREH